MRAPSACARAARRRPGSGALRLPATTPTKAARRRALPRRRDAPSSSRREAVEQKLLRCLQRDALLLERVTVAQRHGAVGERLLVDRERPRRADLVLAAVALADRGRVVVLGRHRPAQVLVERARLLG